ncbi:hypothetical protein GM3708_2189 [Geminocystis sp. NIES-3708]|uniref:hypothetical protein n=1 Tax=Geminocystis sp. NIES-3708 TaxID=1615909 RepID=UPI0005FC6B43|nr:hypothetical protein [Geminocystis sp. NIES-3708]BAQ61783.1 hypothetical protein GM3708_2189 [Geminocystis sp. NIES-3708]
MKQFISNVSYWLSDDGIFFIPIAEFKNLVNGTQYNDIEFPFIITDNAPVYGGQILATAFMWSWVEPSGKRHDNMLVSQVEIMIEMFNKYFQSVELIEYANGYYKGIVATNNKQDLSELISNFSFNNNEMSSILPEKLSLINKVKNNFKKVLNLFKKN